MADDPSVTPRRQNFSRHVKDSSSIFPFGNCSQSDSPLVNPRVLDAPPLRLEAGGQTRFFFVFFCIFYLIFFNLCCIFFDYENFLISAPIFECLGYKLPIFRVSMLNFIKNQSEMKKKIPSRSREKSLKSFPAESAHQD